jgi:hypothetical protein
MAFDRPDYILSETRNTPLYVWIEERVSYKTSNIFSVIDKLDKVIKWCSKFECDLGPQPEMTELQSEFFQNIWEVVLRDEALKLHEEKGWSTRSIRAEMIRLSAQLTDIKDKIYEMLPPEELARRKSIRDARNAEALANLLKNPDVQEFLRKKSIEQNSR